ncbi:MAG: hypothetical protein CMB99_14280 [Flavobacteriaceae bacterium]|nr:hypothetical protein [Flavobacteriaceae bacterium]|tara:strand:+ start:151000 stop:151443 length:444 start_codon:yes stop_codon:yes gene_type:complete
MKSDVSEMKQLQVTSKFRSLSKEIAQWTKFLSIVGFIFVALLLVIGIFASSLYGQMFNEVAPDFPVDMGLLMSAVYLLFAVIYFFPILFLYKFSRNLKLALKSRDDADLERAMEMLKSHYKYIGVLTIITLSLYALAIIAGMLGVFI